VAVPGESIVRALDRTQNRFFGFPLFAYTIRLFPGEKRIDENDCLADLNLPTRGVFDFTLGSTLFHDGDHGIGRSGDEAFLVFYIKLHEA
jgi:hypothetical protein